MEKAVRQSCDCLVELQLTLYLQQSVIPGWGQSENVTRKATNRAEKGRDLPRVLAANGHEIGLRGEELGYRPLRSRCWRGSRLKDFHLGSTDGLARHEENRCCPGGEQIETGNEFCGEGWQQGPVPSQEPVEDRGYSQVKDGIGRRNAAGREERQTYDLDCVGNNGDEPRLAVLGRTYGF